MIRWLKSLMTNDIPLMKGAKSSSGIQSTIAFCWFVSLSDQEKSSELSARANLREENVRTMKKMSASKSRRTEEEEILPEYRFDYSKARPNRFAGRISQERLVVLLDPDVSKVFTTPEAVNTVLRALVTALPKGVKRKAGRK